MSRVDDMLAHAKARVHTAEIPYHLSLAAEQRRLRKQLVVVVGLCTLILVVLGMPTSSDSIGLPTPLGQRQMVAMIQEEGK